MSQSDLFSRASVHQALENLRQTYFTLGLAAPGAKRIQEPGYSACFGDLDHPLCNFAFANSLDPWSARRLLELAKAHRHFLVYSSPEDGPLEQGELLVRSGFSELYELSIMAACGESSPDRVQTLTQASIPIRKDVAAFMVGQFFSRQSSDYRVGVQAATASAHDLPLYYQVERGRIEAAVMLPESKHALGIYNLCIRSDRRGRGLGSQILEQCKQIAAEKEKIAVLQCEARLELWYASHGFENVGKVQVFAPQDDPKLAIIEAFASENLA